MLQEQLQNGQLSRKDRQVKQQIRSILVNHRLFRSSRFNSGQVNSTCTRSVLLKVLLISNLYRVLLISNLYRVSVSNDDTQKPRHDQVKSIQYKLIQFKSGKMYSGYVNSGQCNSGLINPIQ